MEEEAVRLLQKTRRMSRNEAVTQVAEIRMQLGMV
jgi:hypothetical protein